MLNEDRRCPECQELADVVLEVGAIGTDLGAEIGEVHIRRVDDGQSTYWRLFGHGGKE